MNFSGKFDEQLFDTLRGIDAGVYSTMGPLYIQTEPKRTSRGIFPAEIRIIKNPNDIVRVFSNYNTTEQISSIYWQYGGRMF